MVGVVVIVTLTLFFLAVTKSADYFDYKSKLRECALVEIKSLNFGETESLESVPPGYTFFIGEARVWYKIKEIEDQCKVKHCHDGPIQLDCQNLTISNTVEFQNSINETFVCTCETSVPDVFQEKAFDGNYTGTVFSPYVKNWEPRTTDGNTSVPKWNNYTLDEVKGMVAVMATRFQKFSTYGVGATSTSRSWDGGDSTGLVPMATAHVNLMLKMKGLPTLSMLQGIFQNDYVDILEQEIHNAFAAAQDANSVFPGTVRGIIFTSDYVTSTETATKVERIIDDNRGRSRDLDLEVGIRLKSCPDVIPTKLPEADNNLHSVPANYTYTEFKTTDVDTIFKGLLRRVNFVICSNPLPAFFVDEKMPIVVARYGATFLKIQEILKAINPSVRVVAQGGWASWGVSKNGAMNNVSNMVLFWNEMNSWAHTHRVHLDLFEAFDEPWKTDVKDVSSSSVGPSGPFGAEGNYGWFRRYDSLTGKFYSYVPKVQELEAFDLDNEKRKGRGMDTVTVALVVAIMVIVGVTAVLIWHMRKSRTKPLISKEAIDIAHEFRNGTAAASKPEDTKGDAAAINPLESGGEKCFIFALRFPYDKKYELDKKAFSIDESCILGQGHYGIVYKGKINGVADEVAFKTLNSNGSIIELKNLLSEIKIMAYVGKHEHVVNLLGAYTAKIEQGIIYLASEFCSLGSLEKYLRLQRSNFQDRSQKASSVPIPAALPALNYVVAFFESDPTPPSPMIIEQKALSLGDLLKWGYQIAYGMEHLAKKKVIHSDLAARNVLLTTDGTAKIGDFGLSRQLYYHTDYLKSNRNEELPWRWMSIESLRSLVFSIESDVWTFGVTLWEVLSLGEVPYPGVPGWTPSFLYELEVNDYRMDSPQHATQQLYDLMKCCWSKDPSTRPTFTKLKERLFEEWDKVQTD